MAKLIQSQQLRLLQRLSPQQIQGIKLLELPTLLLEERVKSEIEENPVLEQVEKEFDEDSAAARTTIDDFLKAEEGAKSYKLKSNNYASSDDNYTPTISNHKSLHDVLIEQLSYQKLDSKELFIAQFIIGTLDDDGYLRRDTETIVDDLAFTQGITAKEDDVEKIIHTIQQFDPAGIGARNIAECLMIQLNQLRDQTPIAKNATKILRDYFDEFTKKHYEKIMARMGIDQEELKKVLDLIISLNPKPANGYNDESVAVAPTIIPDFILEYNPNSDTFDLQLANGGVPDLKINSSYINMAKEALDSNSSENDKEALQFVQQKIESAKWFIAAIKQRHQTLFKTVDTIVNFQREYFKYGDLSKLKPMILKDIADKAEFDISTISRVVNAKYIQTPFGVFLLKYFFSEGMTNHQGEEVSTIEIKEILKECVKNENPQKPLTDEALMLVLHDRGFQLARRTVAKYREMLDIPVARLRKSL